MATVVAPNLGGGTSQIWTRKYPPLLALVVAVIIAVIVLPSALNLPQTNPSTTLEYAPVPPSDEAPPPPIGNLSSLGLASTGGLEDGGAPGGNDGTPGLLDTPPLAPGEEPPLPPPSADGLAGGGKSPRTKNCVGTPPKQTDDSLAPPCVADFQGDNFGATYLGVTKEEVRILFYIQGFGNYINLCKDALQVTPDNQYFDLAKPAEEGEFCLNRILRTWQQYFNDRFQSYNRFVHFFVYYSGEGDSPELRRADAADNFNQVKPFAVISTSNSFSTEYAETMAKRGVVNFDSAAGRSAAFYSKFPKLIYGYFPTIEIAVEQYVGYICKKVAPNPVNFSGNATDNGKPRVYGLWTTSDPTHPELQAQSKLFEQRVKESCGITFAARRLFPQAGYVQSTKYSGRYAAEAVVEFRDKGVTTILWPGGLETNLSQQGATAGYRPELVVLGDKNIELDFAGAFQEGTFWKQARLITNVLRDPPIREQQCFAAFREGDPDGAFEEISTACEYYPYIRQLFTGIQVAGPRLTPTALDKGFHAIPRIASTSPFVPACFYDPGDYTCVKDAIVERWTQKGPAEDDDGCYQLTELGQRYFADIWPDGQPTAQEKPTDPCNEYDGSIVQDPSPPDDPTNY